MDLTPHSVLRQWLVLSLGELGGSAPRAAVLAQIERTFAGDFTADDREPPPSRPSDTKWRNRVSWERDTMVRIGLLRPFDGRGTPWSLTNEGRLLLEELQGQTAKNDALANFRPKDSADYVARIRGRQMVKRRSHEALIADFGTWCATRGFIPDTEVHPRDLVLRRQGREWLVEAKVVYLGNATQAVRAAIGQVLEYRFFFHGDSPPVLVALFSEPVGDAYVAFLEANNIASIWRTDDGWETSPSASEFDD